MGKKVLAIFIFLLFITGCSQNTDKITGKNGSLMKQTMEKIKQQNADNKNKKDEKHNQDDKSVEDVKRSSESYNKSVENEIKTESMKNDDDNKKNSLNGSATEVAKPAQPQKPTQKEPSQPSNPTESPSSKPICDNTIPVGAYPIEREAEIDAKLQAEMRENQIYGDGTFKKYEVEYGTTDCGNEYFYIIYYKY